MANSIRPSISIEIFPRHALYKSASGVPSQSQPSTTAMSFQSDPSDELAVNTIRVLAVDIVSKSNSGHPGAPMGMAPVSHVLFTRFFHANPKNPKWFNRDRFVLSNGHA